MALGSMTYSEAITSSDNLNNNAVTIQSELGRLRAEINSMDEVLRSAGADRLVASYEELATELAQFPEKVTTFSAYLKEAVETYKSTDDNL